MKQVLRGMIGAQRANRHIENKKIHTADLQTYEHIDGRTDRRT